MVHGLFGTDGAAQDGVVFKLSSDIQVDQIVHGFTPTEYELAVLARHYYELICDNNYLWEVGGQSPSGRRFDPFAWERIETIKGCIGEDELRKALDPVEKKWEKLFAAAKERCRAKGVDRPQDLDAEDFAELIAGAGYIAIPQSKLRPMDEFRSA